MNKGKRLGLIIGTAILSIILVAVFSVVAVRSTTVKKSVELGNKYIAEGNYKEAIIAFEKAIEIDNKNTDVKETLDVLYVYEEIDELYEEGKLEEAQEKLEEIKDMPKFDIIKDYVENIEMEIEEEIFSNGMGNSIQNIISGGNVAYKGNYVFYSNPKDENKLYKMDIESGEITKINDEFTTAINIHNEYIYYTNYDWYRNSSDNVVKRVKFDGSEEETILTEGDDSFYSNIQIIDNYLYYDCNYDPLEDLPFYYSADIYKLDLDTLEKSEVITGINPIWIMNKTNEGKIDLYITQRYGIYGYRDIYGENKQFDVGVSLWNAGVAGINADNAYYNTLHLSDSFSSYSGYDTSGMGVTSLNTSLPEVFKGSDLASSNNKILANDCFYVNNSGRLYSIDLDTRAEDFVKSLYNPLDEYRDEALFEVKGYLAYFDDNNELVIDKDIIVRNIKNDSDEELVKEDAASEEMELKDIIVYVKDEVAKYMKEQIVFWKYDEVNNAYKFLQLAINSAHEYSYYPESGHIIYLSQGIEIVINDNYRNVTNSDYYSDSDEIVDKIVSNRPVTMKEPSDEIKSLAESIFGEFIDYTVEGTPEYEVNGIELYYANIHTGGKAEYDPIDVYLATDGKVYDAISYFEENRLVEVDLFQ